MPLLALSDDLLDMLDRMAEPITPAQRSAFLQAVKARLATLSADAIGPGLLHRVAAEAQRDFLKQGQVAVGTGGKYGRAAELRR